MRLSTASTLLALAAALAEACSLFIPFDEYAGKSSLLAEEAGPGAGGPDAGGDAGSDAGLCKDVDTRSDPDNCGVCGRHCVDEGACDAGRCPIDVLVDEPGAVVRSIDIMPADPDAGDGGEATADWVYFSRTSGELSRTRAGGATEHAPTDAAAGPISLSETANAAIFGSASAIDSFHLTTFDAAVPALVSAASELAAVSMQGSVAYWGDADGLWWKDVRAGGVKNGPLDGSASPVAFDTLAQVLYWATFDGTVYRMDTRTPGFAAPVLDAAASGVESLAVVKKDIVLGQKSQGLLVFELDAAQQGTLVRKVAMADPQALATDQLHVYAVDVGAGAGRGRLYRALPDGTELVILADTFAGGHALAVSGSYVYFGDGARILRTTK